MGSALETLCGQAYGAKQYHMLGLHTQRAMLTLLALSIPLSLIWYYTTTILIALGQDHEISTEAGVFNCWMIPSLLAFALLQCLNRFLQTQNNVIPMLIISGITALLHVLVCWVLVFRIALGIKGSALAITISNWVNVLLLAIYVKVSPACMKTWTGFSKESLHDILSFIKLAVPSAIMICLEYWSFEMVVLLSGLLPNPKLETSVLSISLNTCWMVYMISVGLGGAVSTRVSNELGAGCPNGGRLAFSVMITVAISEGAPVGITTIMVRNVWGKLYSNEEEVVRYVAKMMPLLALSDFLDGFQCVLSGAARGCGWQNLCAFINLGAYYVVGIPSALLFAFVFHFGGKGLWMGIICGLSVQVMALVIVNICTDWNHESFDGRHLSQGADRQHHKGSNPQLQQSVRSTAHPKREGDHLTLQSQPRRPPRVQALLPDVSRPYLELSGEEKGSGAAAAPTSRASCKDLQSGFNTIYWTLAFLISPPPSP
ncbi:hypothetical protein FH972_015802 [Carpinus fangiana]|uniref:Protein DETOXIFICATION n=1 Tax=Carpinus fangiana TaxID=176857 RepID=A0A5N6RE73_9ROSI|nr:hypothetical protein FH972_015802 [Carpinus fangiana]